MLSNDDLLPSQFVQWSDETVFTLTSLRLAKEQLQRRRVIYSQLIDERDRLLDQLTAALKVSYTIQPPADDE